MRRAPCVQGAEAARRAAQAAGISTEFAPVSAVASGHGRAICTLLHDALEAAGRRVPLVMPKPRHHRAAAGAEEPEAEEAPAEEEEDGLGGAGEEQAVISAASPLPPAYRAGGVSAEEEEMAHVALGWGQAEAAPGASRRPGSPPSQQQQRQHQQEQRHVRHHHLQQQRERLLMPPGVLHTQVRHLGHGRGQRAAHTGEAPWTRAGSACCTHR